MFPQLHADQARLISVLRLFLRMSGLTSGGWMLFMPGTRAMGSGTVRFVELSGAIGALEFMALARHGEEGNGRKQDGE